ncbi:type II toxin-antitoxin system VapC family toxin [Terriglobus tenax]|uniref:type II toxin-antitoxin system VapC family toxin n=1 Tax=Terriglobus tenax TaxID=1111115 RepID=UPI0021DFB37C|nr:type II toxin-antitoxin system VapC family toxin [Terriglobus tenax]
MSRERFLLDTNVLSETRRKRPELRVMDFLSNAPANSLFLSVLSIGELKKGVSLKLKTDKAAGEAIGAWVDGLEANFADRILVIDTAVAKLWGEWSAQRPRSVVDTLLAATAVVHGFTFVTRNLRDVVDLPVRLLDPWSRK